MPSHDRLRPLKAWRYIGAYSPELMLCIGRVRVGPLHQSFWAVWDRERLHERTLIGSRQLRLTPGRAEVNAPDARIALSFNETPGVETVGRSGASYAWTRKQGGVLLTGTVCLGGVTRELHARGVIDDSAGYHERHTSWRWCAGVGIGVDGRELAWNLVEGVHDAPVNSERTVWVDGEPREVPRTAGDGLRFDPQAERSRRDNLLIIRSAYRQPFGTFSGDVAGIALAEGYGVTEAHDAWW
ncbi:MAG TPA: DUF2804 family protein [Solirubrobacteraceae bacterium]|nr:DUF2804 family protein [Solirubrobacteraceae bacterium]